MSRSDNIDAEFLVFRSRRSTCTVMFREVHLSVDFDALRNAVKFLSFTRCCLIVGAKRVAGGPTEKNASVVLSSCEAEIEENMSARREVDAPANIVSELVCRTFCGPDRRLLLFYNLILRHLSRYSWLLSLCVARRVVTNVAIEVFQGCFWLCLNFLIRYGRLACGTWTIFSCVGAKWVGLRAAAGCLCSVLVSVPLSFFSNLETVRKFSR